MTAEDNTNGPAVPPALPPRLYRTISRSGIPSSQPTKPLRKNRNYESISILDVTTEDIYEDPDALSSSSPGVSQSETKPRPIPVPRIKPKLNPQLYDTNNSTKANYIQTTNSGHNNNTAYSTYNRNRTCDPNTTRTTNPHNTANTSSTTYNTDTIHETGMTTTTNAITVTKTNNTRAPGSTNPSTVDSIYYANSTNRTYNTNISNSSDSTGNTKNNTSNQSAKNDYMTPSSSRHSLPPPIPSVTKDVTSIAADRPQNNYTETNSSVKVRDITNRHRPPPLPQRHINHSSSMLDLSSSENYQSIKSSNTYKTPRSSRQTPLPRIPPETKDLNSTAPDSPQTYTPGINSNGSAKKPPPPPPRPEPTSPLYCDKENTRNRDITSRDRTPPLPRPRIYHSNSMLDLARSKSRETLPLFDSEEEHYFTSRSSQYTINVNPPYTQVLPEHDFDWTRASTRRYEQDDQSTYSSINKLSSKDIEELLQWLKNVSRQSDTQPLYGLSMEDEIRFFNQQTMNLRKARRLYNLLIMQRKEPMQKTLEEFKAICEKLDKAKKKTKAMGIAGGTTGAVGGVTAVVGIALAPMTMGVSLIATAVGAGIAASAGGFGAHAARTNKNTVNRERVQKLVDDYKTNLADLERCLNYTLHVMKELRRHNIGRLKRAGAHPDVLRMVDLSKAVFNNDIYSSRQTSPTSPGGMTSESLLKHFTDEFDEYFTEKNGQKLKKSKKSKFSGTVSILVKNLEEEANYLIQMWKVLS